MQHGSLNFHHICTKHRRLLKAALHDLLANQIVSFAGMMFLSALGTGQGLIVSGDLSDSSLYQLCEASYACLKHIQVAHNVQFYGRYRDDILIIAKPGPLSRAFIDGIIERCRSIYPVSIEETSDTSIAFLDVTLFKGSSFALLGGQLQTIL
jgi:hypothetical protein